VGPPGVGRNLGFSLAGLALQEAAGMDFADLVEERVLAPAGMTGASLHAARVEETGDFAYGHSGDPGLPDPLPPTGLYYADSAYAPIRRLGVCEPCATAFRRRSWAVVRGALGLRHRMRSPARVGAVVRVRDVRERAVEDVLSHSSSVAGFLSDFRIAPARSFALFS
jgi:CubicO group peptidase (beta-lactamase class C family)